MCCCPIQGFSGAVSALRIGASKSKSVNSVMPNPIEPRRSRLQQWMSQFRSQKLNREAVLFSRINSAPGFENSILLGQKVAEADSKLITMPFSLPNGPKSTPIMPTQNEQFVMPLINNRYSLQNSEKILPYGLKKCIAQMRIYS